MVFDFVMEERIIEEELSLCREDSRVAVYPGTFDPFTNGHLDVIKRALRMFDKVVVSVGKNPAKNPLFSFDERVEMIRAATKSIDLAHGNKVDESRVEVAAFEGLLVKFAREQGACAILRGLRAVSDFEYELQRALMNRKLDREIETVFLMTGFKYIYISSTIVKEAAEFGGNLDGLVPEAVKEKLKEKFNSLKKG